MRAKSDFGSGPDDDPDEEDKPDQCGGKSGCVQPEKAARRMAKLAAIREAKAKHALIPAA